MAIHKAVLWSKSKRNKGHIQCELCSHLCDIEPGKYGFCGMRQNINNELVTHAYGKIIANNDDPIEKKPLYHFLPGSRSYSIATIGCNFRCSFCQNWTISQLSAKDRHSEGVDTTPAQIVADAKSLGCSSISYTYTEPTVFFEFAYDTAEIAQKEGIRNIFVTNGYMSKKAIDLISPKLDAANIDLKSFNPDFYKKICNAELEPVLDSIKHMKEKNIWVEITTLIVTGQNDSFEELNSIAEFIKGIDPGIPWHISRFHPDYKYTKVRATPDEIMNRAILIGKKTGLKYVYPGNFMAQANTYCPGCGDLLIERSGFQIKLAPSFSHEAKCIKCGTNIEGTWK